MSKVEIRRNLFCGIGGHLSLLLALVFVMCGQSANAVCIFENDERIQLHLSPETTSWGTFKGKDLVEASKVFKCQEDVGRFLMISIGSVQWGANTDSKKNYIFDTAERSTCVLKNSKSVVASDSLQTRASASRQHKFLRNCLDIHVVDIAGGALIAKPQQKFCQVEHTGDGAATLRGDMCFIKIRASNQFAIQPALKKECLDQAYLDRLGIEAQDMYGNLNVMVVGDDSGVSTDVQHIGSRPIQIDIVPRKDLLNLSEDYGRGTPQFITDYNIDSDWGPLRIKSDENTEFDISFLVSNLMDKKCLHGSCSSTSNFTQPFFGQVELFQLRKNGRAELIEEWWDGGLVPPNWQGFVKGMRYKVPEQLIKPGAKYRMVATFQNPTDDYAIFLSGLKQMLIRQFTTEGSTVGIDNIPALGTLKQLGVVPPLKGVSNLNSDNQIVELSETIKGLEEIISSTVWPPYYSSICARDLTCIKLGNKKFHQRLVMEFTAGKISPAGIVSLQNVRMQKLSPVYKGYPMQASRFPVIKCEGE